MTEETLELPESNDVTLYAASSTVASGNCGENGSNITWSLDSGGTLTISGSGNLANYQSNSEVPWNGYAEQIKNVNLDVVTETLCPAENCCAFEMLSKINEIKIPEGVTEIPQSQKLFPRKLNRLVLPSTYTGQLTRSKLIGEMYCTDIVVSEDNPVYSSVDGTLFNKDQTKIIQYTRSYKERNYVIPETVRDIDGAFYSASFLQTLTITKNVEIVDMNIYNNMFNARGMGHDTFATFTEAIYVDEENPYFCSVDGVLYNKDMTILIWYPPYHQQGENFIIPNSVNVVAPGAFFGSKCSRVQFPNSVEILGFEAFWLSYIESITLPESIQTIYMACFFQCNFLSKVYIETKGDMYCGSQIFDACPKLKTVGGKGSGCDIEFCQMTVIPANMFSYCRYLTEVNIPNTVTEIKSSAFNMCPSLTNITVDKAENAIFGAPWGASGAAITYLRKMNIAPIAKTHIFTGNEIKQHISITEDRKDGTASTVLVENENYRLNYSNNVNVGTAEIEIDFMNGYAGLSNENLTFIITPKSSSELLITPIPNQSYTSHAVTPNPCITDMER
ncbi:leucine-rich repeat domain-containing protein [Ructibacterium gallinarum]|uniref:Leucine-rich repeat domain-containing protein n=1 Tax=Ructibacterium gallinarum TaxID=2779355 RepID=A0A9D5M522_9FIRM|nr:leucine-rich repeat domain-containing protein [Ructibacterium gallinarum]MBE5040745.1 leucine-rich repeat domain-containing protein [Ructibacterium gallinarum]